VGCGNFAGIFARSIQPLLSEVDLFFASRDLAKAEDYSKRFQGAGAFGSYAQAATDSRVEALYICTPHYLHLEHALLAVAAGKHVLLEKPLAASLTDGEKIISAAEKAGVNLMVAENYRFMPAVRLCKQLAEQGQVGRLRIIQVQQETPYRLKDWRSDNSLNGGGVLIDAGIHKVHFLRYLAGDPVHLFAGSPTQMGEAATGEDGVALVARWDTGEVGLLLHSWSPSNSSETHWVSVLGTEGRIFFNVREPKLVLERGDQVQSFELTGHPNGILPMVQEFVSSIHQQRLPEVTGQEGLRDLEMVMKAYESMEQGASVSLGLGQG
jgi:predicted dehydrogenase